MTKVRVVKLTEDIAGRLEEAAAREGLSLTAFVRRAALLEADRVLGWQVTPLGQVGKKPAGEGEG